MRTNNRSSATRVQALRHKLQKLDPAQPGYRNRRMQLLQDIELAKANQPKSPKGASNQNGRTRTKKSTSSTKKKQTGKPGSTTKSKSGSSSTKGKGLSGLLSADNIQESLKQVNNLRGLVKNGLGYLQQADKLLETLYSTSNSLKDTGILDKLIKQRGKNLTTEDFTNILVALMNSPVGGQLLGGQSTDSTKDTEPATTSQNNTSSTQSTAQGQSAAQGNNANGGQQGQQNPQSYPQQGYPQQGYPQQGYGQPQQSQTPQQQPPQQPQTRPQQPSQSQQQPPSGANPNQPPMGPYPPYNQGAPGPMQQPPSPQTPPQQ